MLTIHKRVLLDEAMNLVAVQIDHADWVEIARRLGIEPRGGESAALQRFEGDISMTEDPMTFRHACVKNGNEVLPRSQA